MIEDKIDKETAEKDVDKWLDGICADEAKREEQEVALKVVTGAVRSGHLVLKADFSAEYTLKMPLQEDGESKTVILAKLKFKNRVRTVDIDTKLKHIKDATDYEQLRCVTSALTEESMGILKNMYSIDTRITNAVSAFFL